MSAPFVLDCSVTMAWFFQVEATPVTDALLEVATANPFDVGAEQALAFATGLEVRMALASPPREVRPR